jgi:hypothetical protein
MCSLGDRPRVGRAALPCIFWLDAGRSGSGLHAKRRTGARSLQYPFLSVVPFCVRFSAADKVKWRGLSPNRVTFRIQDSGVRIQNGTGPGGPGIAPLRAPPCHTTNDRLMDFLSSAERHCATILLTPNAPPIKRSPSSRIGSAIGLAFHRRHG